MSKSQQFTIQSSYFFFSISFISSLFLSRCLFAHFVSIYVLMVVSFYRQFFFLFFFSFTFYTSTIRFHCKFTELNRSPKCIAMAQQRWRRRRTQWWRQLIAHSLHSSAWSYLLNHILKRYTLATTTCTLCVFFFFFHFIKSQGFPSISLLPLLHMPSECNLICCCSFSFSFRWWFSTLISANIIRWHIDAEDREARNESLFLFRFGLMRATSA